MMKRFPIFLKFLLLFCAAGALASCGYQMAGTGTAQLPPHIKTISIPLFGNQSQEPTIERNVTTAVRRAFVTDGRLALVPTRKSDLLMKATLTQYYFSAVAFDRSDVATEYWVYLGVDVEVIDQVKQQTHLKQSLQTRWDYRPGSDVINAEAARQEAFNQAYRMLSQRLVSLVIDKF